MRNKSKKKAGWEITEPKKSWKTLTNIHMERNTDNESSCEAVSLSWAFYCAIVLHFRILLKKRGLILTVTLTLTQGGPGDENAIAPILVCYLPMEIPNLFMHPGLAGHRTPSDIHKVSLKLNKTKS